MTKRWNFTAVEEEYQDHDLIDYSGYDAAAVDTGYAAIEQHSLMKSQLTGIGGVASASVHYQDNATGVDSIVRRTADLIDDPAASPAVANYTALRFAVVAPADYAEDVAGATASSGSTTTIVDTGAGWTVDAKKGMVVTATAGPTSGEQAFVTGNTSDTLTFPAMSVANDNTTVYSLNRARADLYEETLLELAMGVLGVAGALE